MYQQVIAVAYLVGLSSHMDATPSAYWCHADHLGSSSWVTDNIGNAVQHFQYMPFGEPLYSKKVGMFSSRYTFSGKERDAESGLNYFGARYYQSTHSFWLSVDPLLDKYPNLSPYAYCAGNPVRYFDEDGEEWVDIDGKKIKDHSKIKVYIFYDPNAFGRQSKQMYKDAVAKYGEGSVALSDVTTMDEFKQDWQDMASGNIKEVNLNYHGNNQTVMLNSDQYQYITATGDGRTNRTGTRAINVQNLPTPIGDISDAQLNLNTCKSNSKTQYALKGSKQTLMEAFYNSFDFRTVRGTDTGVSYWYWFSPNRPHPQDDSNWQYLHRPSVHTTKYSGVGLPPK